jgi:hypothetical protein
MGHGNQQLIKFFKILWGALSFFKPKIPQKI